LKRLTVGSVPDFRSPKTGLYANLARLNLPYAEAVFDISYFRRNPEPFYVLAKELYPGKFHPTISHAFIALLASKGILYMLFTQNIDCLERAAGVPAEKIVEAHGSFATQRCIECGTVYPDKLMKTAVESGAVPKCLESSCEGLVKPDIVFFGEKLPDRFDKNSHVPGVADLALVIGTSLSVWPFAGLPKTVMPDVPRVLFNLEEVGDLGSRADDVLELGPCDSGVRKLADELGWRDELETLWRDLVGEEEATRQLRGQDETKESLEDEVQKLAEEVDTVLNIRDGDDTPTREANEKGYVARMAKVMESEIGARVPPKNQVQEEEARTGEATADVTDPHSPSKGRKSEDEAKLSDKANIGTAESDDKKTAVARGAGEVKKIESEGEVSSDAKELTPAKPSL
jgi:NAD+-dependent protein deacetylase SIR2